MSNGKLKDADIFNKTRTKIQAQTNGRQTHTVPTKQTLIGALHKSFAKLREEKKRKKKEKNKRGPILCCADPADKNSAAM